MVAEPRLRGADARLVNPRKVLVRADLAVEVQVFAPVADWACASVLEPEQTPAELGSPYMSLSSMGLDEDGGFHIQVALREDVDPEQISLFVEGAA